MMIIRRWRMLLNTEIVIPTAVGIPSGESGNLFSIIEVDSHFHGNDKQGV